MTTELQARLRRIQALHEEHHPGMSILDMGYVRWPEIDACAGILVGVKAPYIAALLNEWPNIAAEIARLTSEVERLGKLLTDTGDERDTLQWKADALAEALKDARAEIILITESAVQRLVENGYECDPAERTYEIPVGKIDTALTDYQEGK